MAAEEGTLSVIIDKVSFIKQVSWLMKATSDDDNPTPGYMYQEICDISLASGSYCQTLLDYLLDRLDKDSYHVKLKVLRIMQFVVQNGHPDFRQGLRRRAKGVQAATKFSGPPDPLHGNTPYVSVRKVAQDLSQMLFDIAWNDGKVPEPQPIAVKTSGGMGGNFYGSSMQGFGNAPLKQSKSFGETFVSGLKDFAERVADPLAVEHRRAENQALKDPFKQGNYRPLAFTPKLSNNQPPLEWEREFKPTIRSKAVHEQTPTVIEHCPGVAGGGWQDYILEPRKVVAPLSSSTTIIHHELTPPDDAHSNDSLNSSSAETPITPHADLTHRLEDVRVDDTMEEEELVQDIVVNSQTLLPPRNTVNAFIKKCSECNSERVIMILNRYLQPSDEQQSFRALLLLDYLMKSDHVSIDHIAVTCASNLVTLFRTSHRTTKAKARKVIRQLQLLSGQIGLFTGMPLMQHVHTVTSANSDQTFLTTPQDNFQHKDTTGNSLTTNNNSNNNNNNTDLSSNGQGIGMSAESSTITSSNCSSLALTANATSDRSLSLTFSDGAIASHAQGGAGLHSTESSPDWPSLHMPFAGSVYKSELSPNSHTISIGDEPFIHTDFVAAGQEQRSLRSQKDSSMSEDSLKDEDSAFDFLNE